MADNYLEKHYDEWLKKKAEWERKKKRLPRTNDGREES